MICSAGLRLTYIFILLKVLECSLRSFLRLDTFLSHPSHNVFIYRQERAGVAIGSGIGCVEEVASAGRTLTASPRGSRRLSPYTLPKFLANLAAGQISIAHKLKGPNHCVSTACTTGAHSIGDAYRFIKYVVVKKIRMTSVMMM